MGAVFQPQKEEKRILSGLREKFGEDWETAGAGVQPCLLIDLTQIKMIIRKYKGQLYAQKLDSLDEMEKS